MYHNEMPHIFFDYAHADFDSLNNYLFTVDWNAQFQYCFDVDECWTTFSKILTDGINFFVPQVISAKHIKNPNRFRHPHFIRLMLNRKAILWKAWKISSLDKDKEDYNMLAKHCTQAINKCLAAKELEMVRKSNLGSFFNFMNKKLKCKQRIQSIKRADGTLTEESPEQADIFNNFVGLVFTTDNGSDAKIERRAGESCNLSSVSFIPVEVFETLKHLKPSTSAGPDGLPNVLLENCATALSVPLSHIFDTSFKDNCLPCSQLETCPCYPYTQKRWN